MKNLILLMGAVYLFFLFAFREENKKPESFAEIIKKDPSRKSEIVNLAKDIMRENAPSVIDPEDEISEDELRVFRRNLKLNHKDKTPPAVRIASVELLEIIGPNPTSGDTLTFYLGAFSNDAKRMKRYNKKHGGHGRDEYSFDMLKDRPAFAVQQSASNTTSFNQSGQQSYNGRFTFFKSRIYVIGRLCPPPASGCN